MEVEFDSDGLQQLKNRGLLIWTRMPPERPEKSLHYLSWELFENIFLVLVITVLNFMRLKKNCYLATSHISESVPNFTPPSLIFW